MNSIKISSISYCFNKLQKIPDRNKTFTKDPGMNRDSIISDIPNMSEHGDSKEDQMPFKKILSKFNDNTFESDRSHDDKSQEKIDNNSQHLSQHQSEHISENQSESQRDSITSNDRRMIAEFEKNLKSGNIFGNKAIDFHQKTPLSIEIPEPEKEEDEAEVIQEGPNTKESKLTNEDKNAESKSEIDAEESDNNYYPQVADLKNKLSPFQNFRRNLLINTESIDDGNLKPGQKTGRYDTPDPLLT